MEKIKKILAEMKLAKQEIKMSGTGLISVGVASYAYGNWGTFILGSLLSLAIGAAWYFAFTKKYS